MWSCFEDFVIKLLMAQSKFNLHAQFNSYSFFSFRMCMQWMTPTFSSTCVCMHADSACYQTIMDRPMWNYAFHVMDWETINELADDATWGRRCEPRGRRIMTMRGGCRGDGREMGRGVYWTMFGLVISCCHEQLVELASSSGARISGGIVILA